MRVQRGSNPQASRSKPRIITDDLPIIIDTREQLPYSYPGAVRGTLRSGDYSLAGHEDRVAVERKSFDDLFNTLRDRKNRERFQRELIRLSDHDYAAVVVEATIDDILAGHDVSRLSPASVINTLVSWSIRCGIHVWFAGDRVSGEALTYRILLHWWRIEQGQAAGKDTDT